MTYGTYSKINKRKKRGKMTEEALTLGEKNAPCISVSCAIKASDTPTPLWVTLVTPGIYAEQLCSSVTLRSTVLLCDSQKHHNF
jgi:hypothetical protein